MACDTKLLKEMRASSQSVMGKYRIAEAGFHQALNRFRVISFHDDVWRHANFGEKFVDDPAHVTSLGVEKKRNAGEPRGAHRADMAAAYFVRGRAHDE